MRRHQFPLVTANCGEVGRRYGVCYCGRRNATCLDAFERYVECHPPQSSYREIVMLYRSNGLKARLWRRSVCPRNMCCTCSAVLQVMSVDATLHSEHLSKAVAAGDNLGRIRLFRQPCTSPYADAKTYR